MGSLLVLKLDSQSKLIQFDGGLKLVNFSYIISNKYICVSNDNIYNNNFYFSHDFSLRNQEIKKINEVKSKRF